MTIDDALKTLKRKWAKAKDDEHIHDAVAYALYHTWEIAESDRKKSKKRKRKN